MLPNNAYKTNEAYLADKFDKLLNFELQGFKSNFSRLKSQTIHVMKKKDVDFDFMTWYNEQKELNKLTFKLKG